MVVLWEEELVQELVRKPELDEYCVAAEAGDTWLVAFPREAFDGDEAVDHGSLQGSWEVPLANIPLVAQDDLASYVAVVP